MATDLELTGAEAQRALAGATAIVVGAGALGSPAATYLAAAGVGRIGLVDRGAVDLASLRRGPLHFAPDLGVNKAEGAAAKLRLLNPDVMVDPYPVRLDAQNAEAIVMGADVVLECSGCVETRQTVNAACCAQGRPLVVAELLGFEGLVISVKPGESACYRCAFPAAPGPGSETRSEQGVPGAMAGVVGSIQALEALKLITATGTPLTDTILRLDGLTMAQTREPTARRERCPACAEVADPASSGH